VRSLSICSGRWTWFAGRPSPDKGAAGFYCLGIRENEALSPEIDQFLRLTAGGGYSVGAGNLPCERRQQLVVNATEPAVTHDQNMVTGSSSGDDFADQLLQVVFNHGPFSHRRQRFTEHPSPDWRHSKRRCVDFAQALRGADSSWRPVSCVGARFKHRQNAGLADLAPQTGDGRGNSRRMVGKIVVDRDARHFTAYFHPPFDVAEAGKRFQPLVERHAHMAGSDQCGAGVGPVVFAG
jgi:hypothetical protein